MPDLEPKRERRRGDRAKWEPVASIIICCYNQGSFLADAIRSALCQTYSRVEIVLVDDGSVDETPRVAQEFPPVRYVYQSNHGLPSARNTGLHTSIGSFVVFLDADDRLLSHTVAKGLHALQSRPECAFAVGGFRRIRADGHPLTNSTTYPPSLSYSDLLKFCDIEMHGAVMYRRDLLESVGGFNERLAASEDYDVYLRLSRLYSFVRYPDVVAEYRRHDKNMTHETQRMLVSTLAVLDQQREFVAHEPTLRAALIAGRRHYQAAYGRAILRTALTRIAQAADPGQAMREIRLVLAVAWPAIPSIFHLLIATALRQRSWRRTRWGSQA